MTATATSYDVDDPRFTAAIDLLRRTGATSFGVRYSDDEKPVVWLAVVQYGPLRGWEAAAGHDPVEATFRLCDRVIDGGKCQHCGRPAGFERDYLGTMPVGDVFCWYQYDPGNKAYVRGCSA